MVPRFKSIHLKSSNLHRVHPLSCCIILDAARTTTLMIPNSLNSRRSPPNIFLFHSCEDWTSWKIKQTLRLAKKNRKCGALVRLFVRFVISHMFSNRSSSERLCVGWKHPPNVMLCQHSSHYSRVITPLNESLARGTAHGIKLLHFFSVFHQPPFFPLLFK